MRTPTKAPATGAAAADRPEPSWPRDPFPLAPVPASILAEREAERRNHARRRGYFKTACPEIDDHVLLGGLETGHVVGLSAEEESFGVALGLQVLSRALLEHPRSRALVITPKPAGVILRSLRDAVGAELAHEGVAPADMDLRLRTALDSVMLSCVFDMDGLWEVLADLEREGDSRPRPRPSSRPASQEEEEDAASEIQDSEDEGLWSPPPSPPPPPPCFILLTHFSSLLTSLFTQRARPAAHADLSLLSSRLRHLSRSLPSRPLVLILNSTTSSTDSNAPEPARRPRPSAPAGGRPLDPSLRSIFNPPPLHIPGYVSASSRRNKPSFGLVFTQLLDLHLLASRIPRTRGDAEDALGGAAPEATFVTVVEVLLDGMGLWTGSLGKRQSREQRWAAVHVDAGRVVDAFGRPEA
ncbi:uncharacterized protein MAM_03341 [Metarhizium album ARSEF 1941]|uniref:Uncharacterized protein n=1 Tax=Metarhizium album (strain ARSEF 1941) TaxID=1081103 RepID=A0A0B2WZ83_METAS|nr:uncharacterized protein MAM_03341 [Metarhizium album ARSEF 1941]KHN98879.1 hypothetical protein MAM_03341 [Metarhizium album ARSEF 1941]